MTDEFSSFSHFFQVRNICLSLLIFLPVSFASGIVDEDTLSNYQKLVNWRHDSGLLFHRGLTFKGDKNDPEDNIQESCSLQPEVGPCFAAVPQWYHDIATGKCDEFVWGGCQGNRNKFNTLAACERMCGVKPETCLLPPDAGTGSIPQGRSFYDPVDRLCKTFLYYGFGGNANNFFDNGDCEFACLE